MRHKREYRLSREPEFALITEAEDARNQVAKVRADDLALALTPEAGLLNPNEWKAAVARLREALK